MSTIDRHLKHVAQHEVTDEMQVIFGMIEAAYTYTDMLTYALDDKPELMETVRTARGALRNALDYGGSLLTIKAQNEQNDTFSKAQAIRAYRYAITTLNETLTRMSNIYEHYRNPSTQELFMQVNQEVSRAYQLLTGIHDQLVAA